MAIESPRFKKINESFVCAHCGKDVPAARSTCRDHCPWCLWSMHVDENPGDRASSCGAKLRPVSYELKSGKGYVIVYQCEGCGERRVNRFLEKDLEPDSFDALLTLTQRN